MVQATSELGIVTIQEKLDIAALFGQLYRVTSPYFCAGFVLDGKQCIQAAPIISYFKGKDSAWIAKYILKKGWELEYCYHQSLRGAGKE